MRICEDYGMFQNYKKNTRITMDLGGEDKKTTDELRRREFYRIRGKIDLESKGINAFNKQELKFFVDNHVITPHTYRE